MELKKVLDNGSGIRYNESIKNEEWFLAHHVKETYNMTDNMTDNMTAKNLESICSQIKDIFEENDIKEVPSFFVIRMCKCDTNVVEDFMWYLKMLNLFEAQFELKKYRDCEQTIKELQDKLGYHKVFHDMENRVIAKAYTATFIYNGRDDVTWNELPLEVRKHDYPYYFNKDGEDCYPYCVDIYDMD